jgi:hypothetical protein
MGSGLLNYYDHGFKNIIIIIFYYFIILMIFGKCYRIINVCLKTHLYQPFNHLCFPYMIIHYISSIRKILI